ncbi:anti-sigma regulatory factor [Rhizocola hellebori]|uniref:Anti-sigma regulatory factor n=1 Tax=Rhizocola hellebori TaxID=1392758 RepID=A0A8J3VHB6_9ACTN|nr:sensor histidine kinase [Rhizocola hellebori]GIH06340.1 anti-sigma regulatory factor [Rhizocola hellebori]
MQVDRFCHEALFYAGREGFLQGVLPFLRQGLAAGEPILVAVGRERISDLRAALGEQADRIQFADMAEIGRNPARIIPHWQSFLERHSGEQRPVRGVGEPIWPGRAAGEVVECQLHERLLNVAFAESRWKLLCPYDVEALTPEVVQEARRSHPMVITSGQRETSPPFLPVQHSMAQLERALPEPAGAVAELVFEHTPGVLATMRDFVAAQARAAGLGDTAVGNLVLAVNELATNSLCHGSGAGLLRLWRQDGSMVCEVRDNGRFDPAPLVGRQRPGLGQVGGRGLWLANQLCDLVQIRTHHNGTIVRLHLRLH